MTRVGNLCEVCNGTDVETLNWFVGANWVYGAPVAAPSYSIGTYTTTSISAAATNIPITISTLTSSSRKLKATWSASIANSVTVTSYPGHVYTMAPNTANAPSVTFTAPAAQVPNAPLGIHCSVYTGHQEPGYTQPDANGNVYAYTNPAETKFVPNGTIGLIVHIENDIARILIEEKLYIVSTEKLKVIS